MKKKVVAAMLAVCMAVSLTACGSKESSDKETTKTEAADNKSEDKEESKDSDSKEEETRIVSVKDISDYVTIGEYKGFTLDRYTQAVTDDDVNAEISYELQDKGTEVKDGTVEEGDTVRILDFEFEWTR